MRSIPAAAKVLCIGLDPAGAECLKRLVEAGIKHFTFLNVKTLTAQDLSSNPWLSSASVGEPIVDALARWLSKHSPELSLECIKEDPLAFLERSADYVLSFSLVLTMHVDREIELGFGKVLYEAPPCALIIFRSDEFHAKMRSQYRLHKVNDEAENTVLEGIDLVQRPEPPTSEKCDRVRKALAEVVDIASSEVLSLLLVIYATGAVFKITQGYPPAHRPAAVSLAGHEAQVEAIIHETIAEKGLKDAIVDTEAIRLCCEEGWSALPLSATIIGALVAEEGIKLITGTGRPVNCVPLDLSAVAALGIPIQL